MIGNFFKLVRYPNLIIIAITQYLMRWGIIDPILKIYDFDLQFSELNFFLLVLSTICITAAGYVINDYFDTKTDMVNRPKTVIVGTKIHRRAVILTHIFLNTIGIGLGVYLSIYVGIPHLVLVFILITGILWFYSTTYKRQLLIGNLIVAFLTALVPLMVILFEIPLLIKEYGRIMVENNADFKHIVVWVAAFSFFAFLITMIREIIKDIEDFEGDSAYGSNTLPISMGLKASKAIIISILGIVIMALVYIFITQLSDWYTFLYFVIFLIIPMVILIYKLVKAKEKRDYHWASNFTKIIMLAGILYALVANFYMRVNFL